MTHDLTPTRQAIAAQNRSGKLAVSGKLKVALDAMLFIASCRTDAAKAAGMKDHSLREAMKKPHVKAYLNAGLEVLRTSERSKNIFALARVRDTSENGMAVVSAAKALEQLSDVNAVAGAAAQSAPGVVIQIIAPAPLQQARGPLIDLSAEQSSSERD